MICVEGHIDTCIVLQILLVIALENAFVSLKWKRQIPSQPHLFNKFNIDVGSHKPMSVWVGIDSVTA